MNKLRYNDNLVGYIFASPFILGFLIFTLYPIISSLFYSFTDYNLFDAPNFIGFDNYEKMK
jgi:multiple sugar transport system permease protein